MVKDSIMKGIKKPHRIPRYIFYTYIRKRVPFTYKEFLGGREISVFSARLYREVKLLNEAIENYHANRSLEVGCGYGRLTPWIAEHSDQHYAVEPESATLNDAKKLYPNIHFYQAKAQKLPFPNCYFDLCVSWTVLEHIPPKELTKAVAEIKRVCTPEATIILAEGVGKSSSTSYWERPVEEWKDLFLPWKLVWRMVRNVDPVARGLVMRFERID